MVVKYNKNSNRTKKRKKKYNGNAMSISVGFVFRMSNIVIRPYANVHS